MMAAVAIVTVYAALTFLCCELLVIRKSAINNLKELASRIAISTALPASVHDVPAVTQALRSALAGTPRGVSVDIYQNGKLLAASLRTADPDVTGSAAAVTRKLTGISSAVDAALHRIFLLQVSMPGMFNGQQVSTVILKSDSSEEYKRFTRLLTAALLISVGVVLLGYLVVIRLRRVITEPLEHIVRTLKKIEGSGSYSHRASQMIHGEFGILAAGLNQLLEQIEQRDLQLLSYRLDLEKIIASRTSDLQTARDTAEAASEAKSRFIATMSHEIRTPMSGVLGMTDLILKSGLNPHQRQIAETIRQSGETLLSIVNDILDLSKIEAGRIILEPVPFNLHELVEDAVVLFSGIAGQKQIELATLVSQDVPVLLVGDQGRLRQILINLINNAIKFTEHSNVFVTVVSEEDDADSVRLRFEVSDAGTGIAYEAQDRIFEEYSQADSSITRKYGGTGLGLTIARHLSELMGGTLELSSLPDVGTVFWFSVRLQKQGCAALESDTAGSRLKDRRVLLISQNSTYRSILQQQITGWGMICDTASDEVEAVRYLSAAAAPLTCDIILLDAPLPGPDVTILAQEIRSNPSLTSLRLVMLCPAAQMNCAADAAGLPVSCSISKPLRMSRLRSAFAELLDPQHFDMPQMIQPVAAAPDKQFAAKILLVEDDRVNQDIAAAILNSIGCSVITAGNGHEALEAWACQSFDLIMMDCEMPGMNGYEAAEQIRCREKSPGPLSRRTPIIAISAHVPQDILERCRAAGMDDSLRKPFTEDQLRRALKRWLSPDMYEAAEHASINLLYAAPAEESVNREYIKRICALQQPGGPDLVRKVLDTYFSGTPCQLDSIRKAIAEGNPAGIIQPAHTLKSSSANLGALYLADLCNKLEGLGRAGTLAGTAELSGKIEAVYDKVWNELARIAGELNHDRH